jgi:hypothetical protein
MNQPWISPPVRSFSEHFATVADTDRRTQCKKWFELIQYGTAEELHEAIEDGGVDVNCRNEVRKEYDSSNLEDLVIYNIFRMRRRF